MMLLLLPLILGFSAAGGGPAAGEGEGAGRSCAVEGLLAAALPQPWINATLLRDQLWERRPWHFSRDGAAPAAYATLLGFEPTSAGIDGFLRRAVSAQAPTEGGPLQAVSDLILAHAGGMPRLPGHPVIDHATAAAYIGQGYSAVVNQMQFRAPAIADLADALEEVTGLRANANLVCQARVRTLTVLSLRS